MRISGLQKVTLLDYPGLVACTVFAPGCNFRCPFCHNSVLVVDPSKADNIPLDEFFSLLEKRKGILDGVCITGGEPLLQNDLEDFIRKIRSLGFKVKLDSNGYSPEKLKSLIDKGLLDFVAMDIKNSLEKYGMTVGIKNFDPKPILESIALLKEDKVGYEFRTTAVREFHTKDDFRKIAQMIQGCHSYFIQNFKDSGAVIAPNLHGFDKDTLEEFRSVMLEAHIPCELRGVD
jgi:pyruvate formate lyase activating enzyme